MDEDTRQVMIRALGRQRDMLLKAIRKVRNNQSMFYITAEELAIAQALAENYNLAGMLGYNIVERRDI